MDCRVLFPNVIPVQKKEAKQKKFKIRNDVSYFAIPPVFFRKPYDSISLTLFQISALPVPQGK
jgi:hypothetical protein